ncbi:MAG: hypothetical protein ACC645_07790 [Pirellulales bacterium]
MRSPVQAAKPWSESQSLIRFAKLVTVLKEESLTMRRIVVLVVIVLALVGTGIITVQWTDSGASVSFDKETARDKAKQLVHKARELKSDALADRRTADEVIPPHSH